MLVNIPGTNGIGAFAVATVNVGGGDRNNHSLGGHRRIDITREHLSLSDQPGERAVHLGDRSQCHNDNQRERNTDLWDFYPGQRRCAAQSRTNPIFVRFKDTGGVTRGSTRVAVRTL